MAVSQAIPGPAGRSQQGFALVALLAIVAAGILYFVVEQLDAAAIQRRRADATTQSLARARELLIGYAVAKANPPGSLPCPDTDNDGTMDSCTAVGRLPWKTLGLGDLRDADGECLWYAVAPAFGSGASPLNSSIPGTITLKDPAGTIIASQVLAVVLAPGAAIGGLQDRGAAGSPVCGGNLNAANYLEREATSGIDNATGNSPPDPPYTFVLAARSDTFNDRLAFVSAKDLFRVLHARIAQEIFGDTSNGLQRYANCAAPSICNDSIACGTPAHCGVLLPAPVGGRLPYSTDPGLMYPDKAWLNDNGWFGIASYAVPLPNRAAVTLDGVTYEHDFP